MGRQLAVYLDTNGRRNPQPQGTCAPNGGHLRIANAGRKTSHCAVCRSMGIGNKDNVAWFRIAQLRNQLMHNPARSMEMFNAIFPHQFIPCFQALGIIQQTCGGQMIMHNPDFVLIPDLLNTHFMEFIQQEGRIDIMNHHKIRLHYHKISR